LVQRLHAKRARHFHQSAREDLSGDCIIDRTQQREQRAIEQHRHAVPVAGRNNRAGERLDFEPAPAEAIEILEVPSSPEKFSSVAIVRAVSSSASFTPSARAAATASSRMPRHSS
jgi:hypothetical protein